MRFLVYIAILAAVFMFWLNGRNNITRDEIVENIPDGVIADPNEGLNAKSAEVDTEPAVETPKKAGMAKPEQIDQDTLDKIQESINKTSEAIKEIERKNALPAPSLTRLSQQELYDKAKTRLVNFFCYNKSGVRVASGAIISPKGYIVTNAHVAEGLDANYKCAIRQGSPAKIIGYAKIVMFPHAFAEAKTRQEQAENDVSIWKMIEGPEGTALPESFLYYEVDPQNFPEKGQELATFSYPSELLGYEIILKSLNMMFAETVVSDLDINLILSTSGLSSQIGSSGGVLVDIYTNKFSGLIFGVSQDENISQRTLFSLTANSIDRVVKNETGQSLSDFLK